MPAKFAKPIKLLLLPLFLISSIGFLFLSAEPVEAAADVCANQVHIDKAILRVDKSGVNPVEGVTEVLPKTGLTLRFTYFVSAPRDEDDFEDHSWRLYLYYNGSAEPDPYITYQGPNNIPNTTPIRIVAKPTNVRDTLLGKIVKYEGSRNFSAYPFVGDFKIQLAEPRGADDGDLSSQIFCSKTASYKVVEQLSANFTPGSAVSGCPNTAFGISTCPANGLKGFVGLFLQIALGLVGGVAFLALVFGGFRLAASQGDPKAIQGARSIITAAISGLLFAIFAIFLLRLLGVHILGLPI